MDSFHISYTDFATVVMKSEYDIVITASRPGARDDPIAEMLGYIRFRKKAGSVEVTNFLASLDPRCLEFGYSTKRGRDSVVGRYGDGLQIAALVLCRNGHHVRITSSSCYWHFGLSGMDEPSLYCRVSEANAETVHRQYGLNNARKASGKPREVTAHLWEDVSILIGRDHGPEGQKICI
jgi:hypothetical protein